MGLTNEEYVGPGLQGWTLVGKKWKPPSSYKWEDPNEKWEQLTQRIPNLSTLWRKSTETERAMLALIYGAYPGGWEPSGRAGRIFEGWYPTPEEEPARRPSQPSAGGSGGSGGSGGRTLMSTPVAGYAPGRRTLLGG